MIPTSLSNLQPRFGGIMSSRQFLAKPVGIIVTADSSAVVTLDDLLDMLRVERDRLADEAGMLMVAHDASCRLPTIFAVLCQFDVGELETRADSTAALIIAIENHVDKVNNAIRAGADDATLQRMYDASANILELVTGVSVVNELFDDVGQLAKDIVDTTKRVVPQVPRVAAGIGLLLAGVALVVVAVKS